MDFSTKDGSPDNEPVPEEVFDDEDDQLHRSSALGTGFFKRTETPFLLVGVALVVVFVIFLIVSGSNNQGGDEQTQALGARLDQLESRVRDLEQTSRVPVFPSTDNDQIDALMQRQDQLQTELNQRMDDLAAQQKALDAKIQNTAANAAAPAATGTKTRYHTVQASENLYRIGLKYGLSVEDLREINQLEPAADIYVGQKLKVSRD